MRTTYFLLLTSIAGVTNRDNFIPPVKANNLTKKSLFKMDKSEAFRKCQSINPYTGRHIEIGKVTYKKLVKEFGEPYEDRSVNDDKIIEQIGFTGVDDVDKMILNLCDIETLIYLFDVNRRLKSLIKDPSVLEILKKSYSYLPTSICSFRSFAMKYRLFQILKKFPGLLDRADEGGYFTMGDRVVWDGENYRILSLKGNEIRMMRTDLYGDAAIDGGILIVRRVVERLNGKTIEKWLRNNKILRYGIVLNGEILTSVIDLYPLGRPKKELSEYVKIGCVNDSPMRVELSRDIIYKIHKLSSMPYPDFVPIHISVMYLFDTLDGWMLLLRGNFVNCDKVETY